MATADHDVNITGQDGTYSIQSILDNGGHYQQIALAYNDGASGEFEFATELKGFPIRLPAASVVGGYIQDIHAGLTTASGATALGVDVISSAGLTVNAILEDIILGITSETGSNRVQVCGLSDRDTDLVDGITAVGVTGNVYIMANNHDGSTAVGVSGPVEVIGVAGVSGTVETQGTVMITNFANDATSGISAQSEEFVGSLAVHGNSGGGWTKHNVVGVTGTVEVDATSAIQISGTPAVTVPLSAGLTNGSWTLSDENGMSFDSWGLTSGVKILAFSTGSSTEYIWVGSATSDGFSLTADGFPLREFDTVFIETDDMANICVASDNTAAIFKFIGS